MAKLSQLLLSRMVGELRLLRSRGTRTAIQNSQVAWVCYGNRPPVMLLVENKRGPRNAGPDKGCAGHARYRQAMATADFAQIGAADR